MKKTLLILLLPLFVFGLDVENSLHIRGFATLDATLNTSKGVAPTYLPNTNEDILKQDDVNYNYSSFGLQLDFDLSNSIDFMTQAIYSKGESNEAYEVDLPWAMLGYNFGDDYKIRVGKMKVPFMKGTETRNINYSFLWARPQVLEKGVNGFNDLYGLDLLKKTYIEDVDLEFQFTVGKAEHQLEIDENNYYYSMSALASYDNSWIRLSFGQTSFDQISRIDGSTIAKDVIIDFGSIEAKLSMNSWLLQAGYANTNNDTIADTKYTYASLAYEFDEITPYLLYSKTSIDSLPFGTPPNIEKNGYSINQQHSVGMRYDFHRNFALKLQYEYKLYEQKQFDTVQEETSYNIYSITLDMVF